MPDPAAVRRVLGGSTCTKSPCPSFPHQAAPPPSPLHDGPTVVWFRGHDLRVHDHAALDAAVAANKPVVALYVLERGAETDGVSSYMRRRGAIPPQTPPRDCPTQPSPLSPNGGFALGRVQRWYLHHSLRVLRDQLEALGITLILHRVDCAEDTAPVVSGVACALHAARVFWNKRYKPRAYPVEDAVRAKLGDLDVVYHDFNSETLLPPCHTGQGRYDDFQSYTRFWIDTMREYPPSRPRPPLRPSQVNALPRKQIYTMLSSSIPQGASQISGHSCVTHHDALVAPPLGISERLQHISDLELLEGLSVDGEDSPGDVSTIGCVAARYALQSFLQDERFSRFSSGGARRDGMVTGKDLATSRLSPHVRFGEISPRILFYAVVDAGAQAKTKGNERGLEAARTFLKNMSLREFGYYMLGRYPHAACKPIMPEFEVFPWVYDKDGMMAKAWETGNTGFPIVDAAMRQLIREGWIHNRMRFLAASFFCKYLLLPWPVGAAHMVRTLVDGDEACNSLGWQWTAGCNSDSFPFSTLVNPLSLHTHSQSTKRAAEYVRKYVPELAGLPDSLVFTPWKASNAERKLYRLGLVPLDEYRMINRHWNHTSPSPTCIHKTYLYPDRIVHGPQARIRARNAMEVMRRIFSAQRQCRTIIVDQTIAPEGRVRVSERETLMIEAPTSTEDVMDLDQNEEMMSSVTGTSSSTGNALKKYAPRSGEDLPSIVQSPRKKQRLEDEGVSSPHWNQKVSCSETTDVMAVSPTSIGSSSISRGEVDLLLSSREVPNRKTKRRPRPSATETHTKTERVDDCLTQAPLAQLTGTLKKRRPSTEAMPPTADGRVSVQALLTPTIMDPTKASVLSSRSPVQMPDSFPNIQGRSNLTHLPSTSSFGSHLTRTLDSHPAGMQSMSSAMHAQPPPLLYTHFQKPTPDATSAHHQKMSSSRNNEPFIPTISSFSDRTSQQFRSMSEQHIRESRVDHVEPSLRGVPAPGRQAIPPANMPNVRQTHVHGSGGTNPHVVQVKERNHSRHTGFDVNRPHASSICQQGVPGMAVMPNHFSGNHPHRAPMVLPFRPGGPVHVAPTGPQPSGLPRQNGGQGYFHPMNSHMNAQPAGPMIFYPSVPQYIDMRVPQMMQPMVTPHPGALPMSFPGANRTMLGAGLNDGRMLTPNGTHRGLTAVDRGSQNGPKNPMEREEIARQMAAMNYYDEAYGGKHWEQWQAIALHLLDQYEFSEDTNRLTTKSYVRLCVLKDELRDANPSGPRVTVNHCKEVFRILQLPVTGEWDRRGHGGVRGPYCYGCVKRSGVQISKK